MTTTPTTTVNGELLLSCFWRRFFVVRVCCVLDGWPGFKMRPKALLETQHIALPTHGSSIKSDDARRRRRPFTESARWMKCGCCGCAHMLSDDIGYTICWSPQSGCAIRHMRVGNSCSRCLSEATVPHVRSLACPFSWFKLLSA